MQTQYLIRQEAPQVPPYDAASMAQGLSAQLAHLLFPRLVERLVELAASWGHAVIHVFDQGFASGISARAAAGLRLLAHLTQGARSPAAPLAAALLRSSHRRPLSNSQAATHPVALRLESLVARLASQLRLVGFCAHAHLRERSQLASRSTAKRKVSELLDVEVWLASLW